MFSRLNDKVTRKAFLKLKNFFKSLANSNDDTRNRKIFDICSDGKKKIGNTIRVQPTSIARRKNKNRGRGVNFFSKVKFLISSRGTSIFHKASIQWILKCH